MAEHSRELELAYAAGFIDADGCITIQNHSVDRRFGQPSISASQVAIEPLVVLQKLFGGTINKASDNRKETHAPVFRWRLVSRKSIVACKELLPFLRYKRRQAELVLRFDETSLTQAQKRYGLPKEILEIRQAISIELSHLNRKGVKRGILTLETIQGRV